MTKMNNQISINIQNYLIRQKITLTELSNRLGVSKQRVSYMFLSKEDGNWKVSNLTMIADALGVNFKDFLMEVLFNGKY